MKRIYSIDFLKLYFALVIALYHFHVNLPSFHYAVNFFFIISGVFLAKKYYSKKNQDYSGYNYTKDHVKSLYPHYVFSLIILLIAYSLGSIIKNFKKASILAIIKQIALRFYKSIPEFFMVQNVGFFDGGLNYPLWQVCALLIAGYFLYTLLKRNEKFTIQLICPLAVIINYTLLYQDTYDIFGYIGCLYLPLLRAFGPMALGVLIYRFILSKDYQELLNGKKALMLNILSSAFCIFLLTCSSPGFIYLILVVIVILAIFNEKSWINKVLNHRIFCSFGDLSYAVYLNHALMIGFMQQLQRSFNLSLPQWQSAIIFTVLLLIYSIITMKIVNYLKKHILKYH